MAAFQAVKSGSTDPDFFKFLICKEFGWLPSQLDGEDWLTIEKFWFYMDFRNKLKESEAKRRKNRKPKRGRRR